MGALDVVQRYFEAWNRHDATALVATFSRGGTYRDPAGGPGLKGEALASFARGLWQVFPDLSFELVCAAETAPDRVAAAWRLRGTHTDPGSDPVSFGDQLTLAGQNFIEVEGDKIRSVEAHFDPQPIPKHLEL